MTAASQCLRLSAPAKLNLALAVSPQIVAGKHLLETVYTTIDLADQLEFIYNPTAAATLDIKMEMVPPLARVRIVPSQNIIWRTIQVWQEYFGCQLPGSWTVRVQKNIPVRAGLGGGSANAAATLLALQQLLANPANAADMQAMAARLGADVAFFLHGGCVYMSGWGEQYQRSYTLPELDIVLAKPRRGLATATVYRQFDRAPQPQFALDGLLAQLAALEDLPSLTTATLSVLASELTNNLTAAAVFLLPAIGVLIAQMEQCDGVLKSLLSGSGSTVFGLCKNREAALAAASLLSGQNYWTAVCRTSSAIPV